MLTERIRRVPIFSALPDHEIDVLVAALRPRHIPAGTVMLREGVQDACFYVLLSGQVEIIKSLGAEGERLLGVREAGAVLGEMGLFHDGHRHTASVRAATGLEVLEGSSAEFDAVLRRQPGLLHSLLKVMSQRLDEAENVTLRDLRDKNRQLTEAYQELKSAQAKLVAGEKLQAEMGVARHIQRSILPHRPPVWPGLDLGMVFEPVESVGGDFVAFVDLGGEGLGMAIGDVSDHGVPAALIMALTYSLLRVEAQRPTSPAEMLRRVNGHLLDMNEAGMFVSLLWVQIGSRRRELTFARAGHSLPLVLDREREALPLRPGAGQVLGLIADPVIDEQRIALPEGGLLLMYTDGVTEAFDPAAAMFGEDRLRRALAQAPPGSAQSACDRVRRAVHDFRRGTPQHDDLALLAALWD